jgi:hypothetical protein
MDTSVTSIGSGAFQGCTGLTSIPIPTSVTSIGSGSFQGCTGLTSIPIPTSVTSIVTDAFQGSGLTTVIISNGQVGITSPSSNVSFFGKTGVQTLPPNAVTIIGNTAYFVGQPGQTLNQTTVNNNIGSATSVSIIGYSVIGNSAFFNKSQITSVTIENSVSSIGTYVFYGCINLTSATLPTNASFTNIPDGTFSSCRKLASINIPGSVTSIGNYVFNSCWVLQMITIPTSVTFIGLNVFGGSGLTSVYIASPNGLGIVSPATNVSFYGKTVQTLIPLNGPQPKPVISGITTSSGSVSITFTQTQVNTTTQVLNYKYSTDNGTTWVTRSPVSTATPLIISGISNGTTYSVRIIAFNGVDSVPSDAVSVFLRPTLLQLKGINAPKASYLSYGYNLQNLVDSGSFTIKELVIIGFVLVELKTSYSYDALIKARQFPGSELKKNGLIQNGIVFTEFLINNSNGTSTFVNSAYSLTSENKEIIKLVILDQFGATSLEIAATNI